MIKLEERRVDLVTSHDRATHAKLCEKIRVLSYRIPEVTLISRANVNFYSTISLILSRFILFLIFLFILFILVACAH